MFARMLTVSVSTTILTLDEATRGSSCTRFPLEDSELARRLQANALEVFPDLSNEQVAARLKHSLLEVGQVRGRLLRREQEERMRGTPGSQNPTTLQPGDHSLSAQGGGRVLHLIGDHSPSLQHEERGAGTTGRSFSGPPGHRL
ncbi:hypothetical protein PI124_g1663 [Phytophthora idaei]|nr:hypothetical protein PI125_g1531 [Phytophthora idaei]KAG3253788.1 hypothetical protein PI124_g1663 [Phytophthora idaei]